MSSAAQAHEPAPDKYDWWRRALAGEKVGGPTLPVNDGDCQAGFWRKRVSSAAAFLPVATWLHDGKMVAVVNDQAVDPGALWTYICRYPVTEEQYHNRVQTGTWHDEDAAVAASLAPPAMGGNNPPQDEADILAAQIEAASANAAEYETISDDVTAAKAQSCRSRLNELSRKADDKREKSKAPHLEAGRAVDKKWKPIIDKADAAALKIRNALSAHETAKARAAAEAARKHEAEQRALRETLAKHPEAPPEYVAAVAATPAAAAEAPKAQIRGAYGKAAAVKVVRVARVVDYEKAVPFFATNAEIRALVDRLAQKTVDAGITPPGVEVTEERKVV